jgi:flagellar assembly protein FliH
MPSRIPSESTSTEPVKWPAALGSRSPTPGALPQTATQRPRPELVIDREKLNELENARQAELIQCRQAALEEGVKKGREAAQNEIKASSDRLASMLRDLIAMKRRVRSEAESDVVKLSLAIARRILHRELTADPDSIQGIVHAGLQKLQNREISRVRIPPAALEPVRSALERVGMMPAITILADPKMHGGEIIFETALGELDASIEAQLQEIERGFADRLGF